MQPARAMGINCWRSDRIHATTRHVRTTGSDDAVWQFRHAHGWLMFGAGVTTLVTWPQARHATRLILKIAWLYFVTGARG